MFQVKRIIIKEIRDSRGGPTIEVILTDEKGRRFSAQIPSGESTGSREAKVFSVAQSKRSARFIENKIRDRNFRSIKAIDRFLLELDGTPQKNKLGGNVLLGISIAFARMMANREKRAFWEVLRDEFFPKQPVSKPPVIFSNFIEGGVHAKNNLDIQEYLVLARTRKFIAISVGRLDSLYRRLGRELKKINKKVRLGDEGGYSLNFKNNFEPLRLLGSLISGLRWDKYFLLGIDAAASEFSRRNYYLFENKKIRPAKLQKIYLDYFRRSPLLCSIEDPFHENDEKDFARLLPAAKNKLIVGDDLTTTNPRIIEGCGRRKSINGVIIKPNQIGTVSETCEAIRVAQKNDIKCIISHRSGEVSDAFIIHLAKASNAYGVKIGAPVKSRASKYKELIRLYH